jgi:hypothetical protein
LAELRKVLAIFTSTPVPAGPLKTQFTDPVVFTDGFGINPEKLAGAANQFTGLSGSEGAAAGKHNDGLEDAGLTRAVTTKYDVKPGVGLDVYLLEVP